MEVKIGVQNVARELVVDTTESADAVQKAVTDALSGKSAVLSLTDERGRRVLVPSDRLGYVEIGEQGPRRVGFGTM